MYPMKEWLRQHPDQVPSGQDPTYSTSRQLRDGLKKMGWTVQVTDNEERMIMPGTFVEPIMTEDTDEEDERPETRFSLEYQLRDFLAENIESVPVNGMKLKLYVNPEGIDGVEYHTAVGPIDILAIDENEDFVVFELKRAGAPDKAIGQLSRYMGWVKKTIGKGKKVRGVIVAKSISENLRYSILAVPDVSLFEYEISFNLNQVKGFE